MSWTASQYLDFSDENSGCINECDHVWNQFMLSLMSLELDYQPKDDILIWKVLSYCGYW